MNHGYEVTVTMRDTRRLLITDAASTKHAHDSAAAIARDEWPDDHSNTPITVDDCTMIPLAGDGSPIGELRTMIWVNEARPELEMKCVVMSTPKPHGDTFSTETPIDVVFMATGEIYTALSSELSNLSASNNPNS